VIVFSEIQRGQNPQYIRIVQKAKQNPAEEQGRADGSGASHIFHFGAKRMHYA